MRSGPWKHGWRSGNIHLEADSESISVIAGPCNDRSRTPYTVDPDHSKGVLDAPWRDAALQGFVQGVLAAAISLVLYGRAVSILGASSAASFAALCPAMTALMAIPVMGEVPAPHEWIGIVSISVGVYVVNDGPLPVWIKR